MLYALQVFDRYMQTHQNQELTKVFQVKLSYEILLYNGNFKFYSV